VPPFDLEDPNAPFDKVKEYNQYNKLVSNRLIRELMYDSEIKVSITVRKVPKDDWQPSMYENNIYVYRVVHNLNTRFIDLACMKKVERISPSTGAIEYIDNLFSPEDVFVISSNIIEVHVAKADDCYITV
jgi:hypothetical protein